MDAERIEPRMALDSPREGNHSIAMLAIDRSPKEAEGGYR